MSVPSTDSEARTAPDFPTNLDQDPSQDEAAPRLAEAQAVWGWTRGHRVALALLLAVLLGFMIIWAIRRPVPRGGPAVVIQDSGAALEARLDPNTADVAALLEIPGLGRQKAQAIVDFRAKEPTGAVVFRRALDLERVPGWGAASAQRFGAFMAFPQVAHGSGLEAPKRLPSVDPDE